MDAWLKREYIRHISHKTPITELNLLFTFIGFIYVFVILLPIVHFCA